MLWSYKKSSKFLINFINRNNIIQSDYFESNNSINSQSPFNIVNYNKSPNFLKNATLKCYSNEKYNSFTTPQKYCPKKTIMKDEGTNTVTNENINNIKNELFKDINYLSKIFTQRKYMNPSENYILNKLLSKKNIDKLSNKKNKRKLILNNTYIREKMREQNKIKECCNENNENIEPISKINKTPDIRLKNSNLNSDFMNKSFKISHDCKINNEGKNTKKRNNCVSIGIYKTLNLPNRNDRINNINDINLPRIIQNKIYKELEEKINTLFNKKQHNCRIFIKRKNDYLNESIKDHKEPFKINFNQTSLKKNIRNRNINIK